jgi:hypothetical protein
MGNRGGHLHTDTMTLMRRRWASRQWICCVLNFKAPRREVWGRSYTELFFLDEPTAFAAGHRPCLEAAARTRKPLAKKMVRGAGFAAPPYAAEMDNVLHRIWAHRCTDRPPGSE